jgi:hypothetical protein
VIDSPAPTISCPANTGAQANSGDGSAFVPNPNGSQSNIGTATATGTNVVVTGSREDGEALTAAFPVGITTVTWTATEYDQDPQNLNAQPTGRSATCHQTITVTSTDTPPSHVRATRHSILRMVVRIQRPLVRSELRRLPVLM